MELSIDDAIRAVSFSDTQVTHFADFANIGWSLDNVTERSKTLSFMVSTILFAFSSDMPPSRLKFRVACAGTEPVPWKSSTRMTGFPPSPSTAKKRQVLRSVRASGLTKLWPLNVRHRTRTSHEQKQSNFLRSGARQIPKMGQNCGGPDLTPAGWGPVLLKSWLTCSAGTTRCPGFLSRKGLRSWNYNRYRSSQVGHTL
jgi:hypothetical protein